MNVSFPIRSHGTRNIRQRTVSSSERCLTAAVCFGALGDWITTVACRGYSPCPTMTPVQRRTGPPTLLPGCPSEAPILDHAAYVRRTRLRAAWSSSFESWLGVALHICGNNVGGFHVQFKCRCVVHGVFVDLRHLYLRCDSSTSSSHTLHSADSFLLSPRP